MTVEMAVPQDEADAREWFMQEFRGASARLYLVAYGVLRNPEDARDAMQEAALKVFGKLDVLDSTSSLEGYLLVTTRNVALDMLRRASRVQTQEDLQPKAPSNSWRPGSDELEQLDDAFRQLPLPFQEVLYFRYRESLNAKQIAERLGISHTNARARLSRAHRSLRRELGVLERG